MTRKKLRNIQKGLLIAQKTWTHPPFNRLDIESEMVRLREVSERLWDTEDRIRMKKSQREFDDEFIKFARSVYLVNDERAALKRALNLKSGSKLVGEKSYAQYRPPGADDC